MIKGLAFILVCCTIGALFGFFAGKRIYFSSRSLIGVPTNDSSTVTYSVNLKNYNKARLEIFRAIPKRKDAIIFVGTSLTEGFLVSEFFSAATTQNRGIGGNTVKNIADRIDEIIDERPAILFLECGINDILHNQALDSVLTAYEALLMKMTVACPQTKIFVQSVLPTAIGNDVNEKIISFNSIISAFCQAKGIKFIDLYSEFLKGDAIDPAFTYDGVHLTGAGYRIWSRKIESFIR